jgi:alkyl sulfatase BDS1-like metallo-beta-lactamase superfamily hydrolase
VLIAVSGFFSTAALAQPAPVASKPATAATKAANAALAAQLPFTDKQDFEDAQRGLLKRPDSLTIKDAKGRVVWDLEPYKQYIGLDKPAPDTVNPSLWRNALRGYDLSKITFVQGKLTGSRASFDEFFGLLDTYPFWFNIATP